MIDAPHSRWFTSTLLYWDAVSAIVPQDVLRNPEQLPDETRELLREGLLLPTLPDEANFHFVDEFDDCIQRLYPVELERRRTSPDDAK